MRTEVQSETLSANARRTGATIDGVTSPGDTYIHGHADSVLRSHRWRTADNSAAYLLPTWPMGCACSTSVAAPAR